MLYNLHDMLALFRVFCKNIAIVRAKFHSPFCRVIRCVKTVNDLREGLERLVVLPLGNGLLQEGWSD